MITLLAAVLLGAQPVTIDFVKPFSLTTKFDLTFTNSTKQKLVVLSDGCSWGWMAIRFELKNPAGKSFSINRIDKEWYRNFPMGDTLLSHGKLTRTFNLADGTWQIPIQTKGSLKGWQVRATYTPEPVPTDKPELYLGGSVSSSWITAN